MARSSSFWVVVTGLGIAFGCATGNGPGTTGGFDTGDGGSDDAFAPCVPNGPEVCDGVDNNCDGRIDEGFDKDGDTYFECPRGALPADCNDADPKVHPGAMEICNGIDDNCDGQIDEGFDMDKDGFKSCVETSADGGAIPKDCDDNDPTVYPGAKEICDG